MLFQVLLFNYYLSFLFVFGLHFLLAQKAKTVHSSVEEQKNCRLFTWKRGLYEEYFRRVWEKQKFQFWSTGWHYCLYVVNVGIMTWFWWFLYLFFSMFRFPIYWFSWHHRYYFNIKQTWIRISLFTQNITILPYVLTPYLIYTFYALFNKKKTKNINTTRKKFTS